MHFLHLRLGIVPSGFLAEILHTFATYVSHAPLSSSFIWSPKRR